MTTKFVVADDLYRTIDRRIMDLKRRLNQEGGSPLDPEQVARALQRIIEGDFGSENEYLVPVGYNMPRDKTRLEAEFSKDGVSELFYGNYKWQLHSSCAGIDQTPGNRVMLLKYFGRCTMSEANIAEMDKLGYRPATHLEAHAFAKTNPELQRQFWIVALGSSTIDGDNRCVAVLDGASDGRILSNSWFGHEWYSGDRFLFVRK
jgi:hypothetical protein